MPNPLYQQLNQQNQNNQFNLFMQNPAQYLANMGIQIPQGMQNDPKAIIQNMLNNGMISQDRFNSVLQYLKQNGIQFS